MLFQHINRHADKHRKRVYLALVVLIGLSFVVFVTPRGCDRVNSQNGKAKIGEIFGTSITQDEFRLAMQKADLGYLLATGQRLGQSGRGNANERVMTETIRRIEVMYDAKRRGLDAVSDEEFAEYVKTRPLYQTKGAFDADKLKNHRDNITRSGRFTGHDFDEVIRENIVVQRVENMAKAGIVVSPAEVRDAFSYQKEEFVLNYAEVKLDADKHGDPAEEELDAYFKGHQDELHLPNEKVIRVATFAIESDPAKITVPGSALKAEYERLKDKAYKGKTFDQAKAAIQKKLSSSTARSQASAKARDLLKKLETRPEGEDLAALGKRFDTLAKKAGATVKDSKPFAGEPKVIPGFEDSKYLSYALRMLSEDSPLPKNPSASRDSFQLPVYLKTIPGAKPEKLEQVRDDVIAAVLGEKAKVLFKEKALPYADELKGMAEASKLAMKAYEDAEGKSNEERIEVWRDMNQIVTRYLSPAFKPEMRSLWFVTYNNWEFRGKVEVTDEQIADYHKAHPEKYNQEEKRASQIQVLLRAKMTEKAKKAARARMEGYLARLQKGESFADIALGSDDVSTRKSGGDLGFEAKHSTEVEKALKELEIGQVSEIIETSRELLLIKYTGKRQGTPLGEATDEIRRQLLQDGARVLAEDKAADFSDALLDAYEQAVKDFATDTPDETYFDTARKLFEKLAKEAELEVQKIDEPVGKSDNIPRLGRDNAFAAHLFSLDATMPVTSVKEVSSRQCVAILTGIVPGRLYDLEKEGDIIAEKLSPSVRTELARAAAKSQAEDLHQKLAAAIQKDGKVPEKIGDIEIKTSKSFPREKMEWSIPGVRDIMEAVEEKQLKAGDLLDPVEQENSFVVARLASRTLPADEAFTDEAKTKVETGLRRTKEGLAVLAFYEQLDKAAAPSLFGSNDAEQE